ncbi:MAG: PAS domain S-box protein [Armatimonadetes bacterium]|nr:PAS domain S-box protein [Armatimonadota bacterium]
MNDATHALPLHLFAEHTNDVFFVLDLSTGRHLYVSPAFESLFGVPSQRVIEDPQAWLECVHPDDRLEMNSAATRQHGDAGQLFADAHAYRVVRPDGSLRWVRSRKFLVEKTTLLAGIVEDVTDLMQARESLRGKERKLRHIEEISPVMLYTFGPSQGMPGTGVTYMSANVRRIMGYPPEDFASSGFWAERVHPEDAARVFNALEKALHQDCLSQEYRFRHADGSWRWMHDELRMVRDAQGRPEEFIGCWRDITESVQAQKHKEQQRLAEQALHEVEGQLHHAQKMESLGRLAGGIAHDFNNVLTIIMWYSEFLLARNDEVLAVRPELEEIHRAAERAAALTRKLTAFSRRQVLAPRVVSLKDVVIQALACWAACSARTWRLSLALTKISPTCWPIPDRWSRCWSTSPSMRGTPCRRVAALPSKPSSRKSTTGATPFHRAAGFD